MKRLAPVVAFCCLAGLSLAMVSAAPTPCDEHKKAAQLVNAEKGCCPIESAAVQLVSVLKTMDAEAPGREHLVAALKSLSKLGPQAETRIASLCADAGITCSKSGIVAKVDGAKSECSKSKTARAVAQVAAVQSECATRKAQAVAQVAAVQTECAKSGKTGQTRYVAFGCDKSDRIARVAARAYVNMLCELKKMSGAEGCPLETASKVLASISQEMEAERVAEADDPPAAVSVSLGAVSDKPACQKN